MIREPGFELGWAGLCSAHQATFLLSTHPYAYSIQAPSQVPFKPNLILFLQWSVKREVSPTTQSKEV